MGCEGVDWIQQAQHKILWRSVVNMATDIQVQ
jgi:hypothetical protein